MNILLGGIGIIVLFFVIFEVFLFLRKKRKRIPSRIQEKILGHFEKISSLSWKEQIIEYDKILDLCLTHKGYTGSLGEKMKAYGKSFRDPNGIWTAHKLRNRIAHEMDFTPSERDWSEAKSSFRREIELLMK